MKINIAYFHKTLQQPTIWENRLSDCHNSIIRRFILFSFKHQTNITNCYVSLTEPMEGERQNTKNNKYKQKSLHFDIISHIAQ